MRLPSTDTTNYTCSHAMHAAKRRMCCSTARLPQLSRLGNVPVGEVPYRSHCCTDDGELCLGMSQNGLPLLLQKHLLLSSYAAAAHPPTHVQASAATTGHYLHQLTARVTTQQPDAKRVAAVAQPTCISCYLWQHPHKVRQANTCARWPLKGSPDCFAYVCTADSSAATEPKASAQLPCAALLLLLVGSNMTAAGGLGPPMLRISSCKPLHAAVTS